MNLTDGILRARYRGGAQRAAADEARRGLRARDRAVLRPPTSFKKGHRIRVDISSSNFPHFDVNPNTGEPLGLSRRSVVAPNTVYRRMRGGPLMSSCR